MTNRFSTEALSLRTQAVALLQQAEALDGLKPFIIHHKHEYGDSAYMCWSDKSELDREEAVAILDTQYEPDKGEYLSIHDDLTLEELAGVAVTARLHDVLDSLKEDKDEGIPQAYHTALNWMGYAELKTLLEEVGIAANGSDSEDDLREAVRANLIDGTIPKSRIDITKR